MRPVVAFCARSFLVAGLVLFVNARANAVAFTLDVYNNGVLIGSSDASHLGCVDNPDGVSAHCFVQNIPYGPGYEAVNVNELDMTIDSDPVVTGTMTVTNSLPTTQLFSFIFTLPVSPIPGSSLTGGSARGTVTDT